MNEVYQRQNLSFARRSGRRLSQPATSAMQLHQDAYLQPLPLLANQEYYLEIGFGYGEHLLAMATANPELQFIGAEPYMNGVAEVVLQASTRGLSNIRVWADDVWLLLAQCPERCFARVYILFPDPWPKRKHMKRRLINTENLKRIASKMAPGAELVIATDHPGYANWISKALAACAEFTPGNPADNPLSKPPANAIITRYQRKNLANSGQVWQFYSVVN